MKENKKDEKREQKGGAVPWGAGSSGGAATQTLSRAAQVTVRGVVQRSLMASVAHFFSTGVGMLTLTAIVAGTSFFSLWDLNHQREAALAKQRAAATFQQGDSRTQISGIQNETRAASNADSLGYLAAANPGGLSGAGGQLSAPQGSADGSAQSAPQPQAAQPVDANASNQNKSADAAGQAQAAAQGLSGRYGQMSTGLGSGHSLAGGVGMAGGVGRPFDSKTLVAQLPHGAGNGSSSGAAASTAGVGRTAIQGGGGSKGGNAMGQLRVANGFSQAGKMAGSGEGQSYNASKAFEGNNGIGGAGGEQIGGTGDQSAAAQTGGAGLDNGTPVNQPNTGTGAGASNPSVPSAGSGTDVTPWGNLAMIAEILIMIAGVLLLAASSIVNIGLSAPVKHALAWIAAALAAAVTIIGIILMVEYGQMLQGGIFTAVGALTTVLAVMAATASVPTPQAQMTQAAQQAGLSNPLSSTPMANGSQFVQFQDGSSAVFTPASGGSGGTFAIQAGTTPTVTPAATTDAATTSSFDPNSDPFSDAPWTKQ